MKVQTFLNHYGIHMNPFVEEDAQTDPVFKKHCLLGTHHPSWDKICGDPGDPSTSLVFGEKGAGKTALKLQIIRSLQRHNEEHPSEKVFIISYDNFNPFLDRFLGRVGRPDRVFKKWKLWDHIDAILSLGITQLVDGLLKQEKLNAPVAATHSMDTSGESKEKSSTNYQELSQNKSLSEVFDGPQRRDLLLLAAIYDQSMEESLRTRWGRLRKKVKYPIWMSYWDRAVGGAIALVMGILALSWGPFFAWISSWWFLGIIAAGFLPLLFRFLRRWWLSRGIVRHVRTGLRDIWPLTQILMKISGDDLSNQPFPNTFRSDDRYELLLKFKGLLQALDYESIVVLMDRVDEPNLVGGSAERMRDLVWPILDNKLLKQDNLGFKMLLPVELVYYIDREDRDFHQRARLDKQNFTRTLDWTGEALYDVANARLKACAVPGKEVTLRDWFDDGITEQRLLEAFRSLRVPRHLFQFLYRLLVAHCNSYTDDQPEWKISKESFESTLTIYRRDQEAFSPL
ncbi:Hypothetical protein PBC10988_15230 [Planctomycetales bacterium 10988]|nr:Hypothetical protein PBC10988_15230 [Planctomycetales bacterium 10988]